MIRAAFLALALGCAGPALAQDHSGHGEHNAPPPPTADPHAGHAMPADPHAGHAMPPPAPPTAAPPPAAASGPDNAADAVFGAEAMRASRDELIRSHGGMSTHRVRLDRFEFAGRAGRDGYAWDSDAFYGPALDRLWLKSEGEGAVGEAPNEAEVQVLWGHAIAPFFDLQAGVRHDFRPDPERTHLVLGVQGTAPYWLELDLAAFLSDHGDLTARLEGEYDLAITQRLILQPRLELELAAQAVPEIGLGRGLTNGEAGLRLRYELKPEFAPYVGVQYERAFAGTARLRRAAGERVGGWSFLAGVRAVF